MGVTARSYTRGEVEEVSSTQLWVGKDKELSWQGEFVEQALFNAPTKLCLWLVPSLQVSECSWPVRQAPSLHNLYAVCKNMHNWLQQNPKNVCVIHCMVSAPHSNQPGLRDPGTLLVECLQSVCEDGDSS